MISYPIRALSFYAFIISVIAMIAISLATPPHSEKLLDETFGFCIRDREKVTLNFFKFFRTQFTD